MGTAKPLGRKAYGSIGHLPNSRLGSGDHSVPEGKARICTIRKRDKHDQIIVQEKLDGSCCAVAKVDGEIVALGRAGWRANTSPHIQHHFFHDWVDERASVFEALLADGERIVGEWLAQAHGTRYALPHDPFVAFDLMRESTRLQFDEFRDRIGDELPTPALLSAGDPIAVDEAMTRLDSQHHGALDPIEGVMYRVERRGKVDFLAKFVRPGKVDGAYLPEMSGDDPVWNWHPQYPLDRPGSSTGNAADKRS